jgi:hypothetical protein
MLLQQELFEVVLLDSSCFEQHNFSLTQVNDVLFERIYHQLVVAILGFHSEREK